MNRWFILTAMAVAVAVCIFFYTPIGIVVSMLTTGIASLATQKLHDPLLWFVGLFFVTVLLTFVLFWWKLRKKDKKQYLKR